MATIKIDKEILSDLENYKEFLTGRKTVSSPILVNDLKNNHPSSLFSEVQLISSIPYGNTSLSIEIRDIENYRNFSLSILSDKFPRKKCLFRYDVGNGTHRNNCSDIPLKEQQVPTPHFHRFDEKGRFLAYQTAALKDTAQVPYLEDIEFGTDYFSQESNITDRRGDLPRIEIGRNLQIPFPHEDFDPNNGIKFK